MDIWEKECQQLIRRTCLLTRHWDFSVRRLKPQKFYLITERKKNTSNQALLEIVQSKQQYVVKRNWIRRISNQDAADRYICLVLWRSAEKQVIQWLSCATIHRQGPRYTTHSSGYLQRYTSLQLPTYRFPTHSRLWTRVFSNTRRKQSSTYDVSI